MERVKEIEPSSSAWKAPCESAVSRPVPTRHPPLGGIERNRLFGPVGTGGSGRSGQDSVRRPAGAARRASLLSQPPLNLRSAGDDLATVIDDVVRVGFSQHKNGPRCRFYNLVANLFF